MRKRKCVNRKVVMIASVPSGAIYQLSPGAQTMDTWRLNPYFFAAQIQIQIPIPNKYLGCGYKGLFFVEVIVE